MIKVVIFEDDLTFRRSLTLFWKDTGKIYVAATFPDGEGAVEKVKKHYPHVVLLDIEMPNVDGITALKAIKAADANCKVLILTTFQADDKIFAAICAGADGYMLKSSDIEGIEEAIEDVHLGGAFMTPSIARRVMKMFQQQNKNTYFDTAKDNLDLREKEIEVLQHLAEGKSRKKIADVLGIELFTVGDYTKSIYKKLHVNSAMQAVNVAKERKIF